MPEILPASVDADASGRVEFEPQWLRVVAFASASAVAAFGAVGLATAVAGVYHAWLVFPVGAVLWIGLLALARPLLVASPDATPHAAGGATRSEHLCSGLAVVFVIAMSVWNARHASQHVLINRDPGAYTNAGRWIAQHGNLRVVAATGPFAHQAGLTFGSFAMYPNRVGTLSFQFAHLLPALLAEAHDLGGDRLMFAATPLIGGIALLAFFVGAWRLLRNPYVALAALVSFAFLLPEVSFSRDSFSEIPMQVLLFTALWILTDVRVFRSARSGLVVGLLLGMLQAARIDALVALTGLPVLFAIIWVRTDERDRRSVATTAGACALGLIPGLVLGFTDVTLRSHQYLEDLRGDVKKLGLLMLASIVVAFVVVIVVPRLARRITSLPPRSDWIAAAVVLVAGFGVWFVRPRLQHVHGAANPLVAGLQAAAHVAVDARRNYAERSLQWMSWYLGPLSVAAAIVGAALLVRWLVRGQSWFTVAGIALLFPASAVYLYRPNISTDQIWVMRRYLFSALPLLTLLAFGVVAGLLRVTWKQIPRFVTVGAAVVIGVVGIAWPVSTVAAVPNVTEQRGDLLALRDACGMMGDHAAIVLLQSGTGLLYEWAPQSLRGWCDAPVAVMAPTVPDRAAALAQLAAQWSKAGRTLWVVSDLPATIRAALPAIPERALRQTPVVVNPDLLQLTVVSRPRHYQQQLFSLVVARVPAS